MNIDDVGYAPPPESDTLTSLDPRYLTVTRIRAIITALPFILGAIIAEASGALPFGVVIVPVFLIAAFFVLRVPSRRYHRRGYAMSDDRLRVVSGVWFRSDTVVPFGRVQHIDVDSGPLERAYGLATLTVHTAGTHNASVHLPGLEEEGAKAMRETIRAHIRRDTL